LVQEKIVLFVTSLKLEIYVWKSIEGTEKFFPLSCDYTPSVMYFIVSNLAQLQANSSEDIDNTRNKYYLHRPPANLHVLQQVHTLLASKSFKSLPPSLKL